jgi:hypothetical protein
MNISWIDNLFNSYLGLNKGYFHSDISVNILRQKKVKVLPKKLFYWFLSKSYSHSDILENIR